MGVTLEIKGMEKLTAAFNGLPDKLQKGPLRKGLRAATKVVKEYWRHEIQSTMSKSDPPAPHMADTLHVKAMKRDRSKAGRVGYVVISGKRDELAIRLPSDAEFAVRDRRARIREQARKSAAARGSKYVAPVFARKNDGPGYYPAHRELGYIDASGQHVPGNPAGKRALEASRGPAEAAFSRVLGEALRSAAGLDSSTSDDVFFADAGEGEEA